MFLTYFLLIIGFISLIKGAGWLVDGSASLAKRLGISTLVIGLTIVAFGTSTPELVVNLFASFRGNVDIAIGNIIGSNIVNIFLILGAAAVIYPLTVQKSTTYKEIPLALLAAVVVAVMANDALFDGLSFSTLTRTDGITLIGFFAIFLYYAYSISKNEDKQELNPVRDNNGIKPSSFPENPTLQSPISSLTISNGVKIKQLSTLKSIMIIIAGIVSLALGGQWIVDSASQIATSLGASEALIGLTIVAIGTSLPELATSVTAAFKRHSDIAVGNVVGSNIFNLFWILGVSSIIRPLPFTPSLNFDIGVMLLATALLFLFMFIGKKHVLQKHQGFMFLILYGVYITYLVMRG